MGSREYPRVGILDQTDYKGLMAKKVSSDDIEADIPEIEAPITDVEAGSARTQTSVWKSTNRVKPGPADPVISSKSPSPVSHTVSAKRNKRNQAATDANKAPVSVHHSKSDSFTFLSSSDLLNWQVVDGTLDQYGSSVAKFDRHKWVQALSQEIELARGEFHTGMSDYIGGRFANGVAAGIHIENNLNRRLSLRGLVTEAQNAREGRRGKVGDDDRAFIKSSFDEIRAAWQNERKFILFIKDRLSDKIHSLDSISSFERLERLKAFNLQYGDEGLEDYARLLFPEWSFAERVKAFESDQKSPSLPKDAPEKYQGLRSPETPPTFVKRVYGPWLGHGLDRGHIRQLDPTLYQAIVNWSRRNKWPTEIDLPTRSQQIDRKLERLQAGEAVGDFTLREMQRTAAALQRRRERQK